MSTHEDTLHDVQFDYYGNFVASCSSDRTVKVWQVEKGLQTLVATLRGHTGPVWQVSWAHPKFGSCALLASCSFDHKVIIWSKDKGDWQAAHLITDHSSSVNAISWAPHEHGLMLVSGSADGFLVITCFDFDNACWRSTKFEGHQLGCNSVSWEPYRDEKHPKSFVSGGCDNLAIVWRYNEDNSEWQRVASLNAHTDWVRDAAWCPSSLSPFSLIATASQDKTVIFWTQDHSSSSENLWNKKQIISFGENVVWKLSWNILGTILAVTTGDGKITLLKEHVEGEWKSIDMLDAGVANPN